MIKKGYDVFELRNNIHVMLSVFREIFSFEMTQIVWWLVHIASTKVTLTRRLDDRWKIMRENWPKEEANASENLACYLGMSGGNDFERSLFGNRLQISGSVRCMRFLHLVMWLCMTLVSVFCTTVYLYGRGMVSRIVTLMLLYIDTTTDYYAWD